MAANTPIIASPFSRLESFFRIGMPSFPLFQAACCLRYAWELIPKEGAYLEISWWEGYRCEFMKQLG